MWNRAANNPGLRRLLRLWLRLPRLGYPASARNTRYSGRCGCCGFRRYMLCCLSHLARLCPVRLLLKLLNLLLQLVQPSLRLMNLHEERIRHRNLPTRHALRLLWHSGGIVSRWGLLLLAQPLVYSRPQRLGLSQ